MVKVSARSPRTTVTNAVGVGPPWAPAHAMNFGLGYSLNVFLWTCAVTGCTATAKMAMATAPNKRRRLQLIVFVTCVIVCISFRRNWPLRVELGGPERTQWLAGMVAGVLWEF